METNWTNIAEELNYSVKNYEGLTKQIVQIKNRAQAYGIDPDHEELINGKYNKAGKMTMQGLKSLKGVAERKIGRVLADFPIWSEWLVNVPGIGNAIGGKLISIYYFKSVPICTKCGADLVDFTCPRCDATAKGNGVLKFRIALRDFPTISSWWHFMGRHTVGGVVPTLKNIKKLKPNPGDEKLVDWSPAGKQLGYAFADSVNRIKHSKYNQYAEKRKRYRENTHPKASKGHRHNMAWNETFKLFLSHFWQVDHILSGAEMTDPWCVAHGGHDKSSIIEPYYFDSAKDEAA